DMEEYDKENPGSVIKYYEVEMTIAGEVGDDDNYSICIKGVRKPSLEEAALFLQKDMKLMRYDKIVSVDELTRDEAHSFYNMIEEKSFPVFGL
ncbi:MAG: hypothetical protein ACRC5C_07095, partial [Bacilli bacterium]